jgi:lipoyl(octanoyl) transferase
LTGARSAVSGGQDWRLLLDPPADAAWNMAVDESLLEASESAAPETCPVLRLYGWRPAAVSLGRSQRASGAHDSVALWREGIELVRRPTGGDAVLHDCERTYAVVSRLDVPPFAGGAVATYRAIAAALALGLKRLGVPAVPAEPERHAGRRPAAACFTRLGAWEIAAAGRKLVGSAQARRKTAFLQHGSIPMRLDPARLGRALGAAVDGSRFIDLSGAAGRDIPPEALDQALIDGFEKAFRVRLRPGVLTEREALRAAELRCWKYDSVAWTRDGAIGAREARWGPAVSR